MTQKGGFFAEFKQFIARGNVMDLAVGVMIGTAFKAIVDSLVNDILMPLVGIFADADSFANLTLHLGSAEIRFGNFIAAIINFIMMALVLFCIVRTINRLHGKKEKPAASPAPSKEEFLLAEIRDLLKERKS